MGAKVENRPLGLISGLFGSLKKTGSTSTTQKIDFLVLEYDWDNQSGKYPFARHKGIRIHLKPERNNLDAFQAIMVFDREIKESLKDIVEVESTEEIEDRLERFLVCTKCAKDGKDSYFMDIGPGFKPQNDMEKCCSLKYEDDDERLIESHEMNESK